MKTNWAKLDWGNKIVNPLSSDNGDKGDIGYWPK